MKHLTRKPLLPLLLLVVFLFSGVFLTFFQEGIRKDRAQVEALYDNSLLTIEITPGVESGGMLRLQTHKATYLEAIEQVSGTLHVMQCNALIGDTQVCVYGTNDPVWLARYQNLDTRLWEQWDWNNFTQTGDVIPCILGEELAESLSAEPGDTLSILPVDSWGKYTDSAPNVTLTVAGFYRDPTQATTTGIMVPEEIFLYGPKLLYNSNMMSDCFYRTFVLNLDPACNRDYEAAETAIEEVLSDAKQFDLVSNFRTLRRAVGPLERKLAVQEKLVLPLAALFAIAGMVCCVFLARSLDIELFLRIQWGEKRWAVFGRLTFSILLWLVLCGVAAAGACALVARDLWSVRYILCLFGLCGLGAAVPIGVNCRKNLVTLYQSKEGE